MIALREYVEGDHGPPWALLDGQLVQRFGWTFDQLDCQEEDRVLIAVQLMNMLDAYSRVMYAVEQHRTDSISADDMKIWQMLVDIGTEYEVVDNAGGTCEASN